ncbi:MAG: metallophosphoesterase [Puniceicoccaceae bacterium]
MPGEPILIVPDVHQDEDFLLRCLRLGSERRAGEVILLGDLLDSKSRHGRLLPVIRRLVRTVGNLLEQGDVPATLLWGNHDWKYWSFRKPIEAMDADMRNNFEFYAVNDLSILTVDVLLAPDPDTGRAPIDLWGEHAVLAAERNGWLITHAGVAAPLWPGDAGLKDGVAALNETMRKLVADPPPDYGHPLLGAGPPRGGFDPVGGPLWLDFVEEFSDDLPFPQIVGHTRCQSVLRKGRSVCLDVCQQVCAILHPDGTLEPVTL